MPYLVRVNGPLEPLSVSGRVGALSWGDIVSIPLNKPIRVKALTVRLPSADSGAHNADAGSKRETIRKHTKSAEEIIAEIRREYHLIEFKEFQTRDEALNFIDAGITDHDIIGTQPGVTKEELRKAYIKKAAEYHPDFQHGDTTKFQQLQAAYERLKGKYE